MKLTKAILLLAALMVIIIGGCSSNGVESSNATETEDSDNKTLDFPEKEITMYIPFGAGGGMDTVGRGLSDVGSKYFDKTITIVNREGAGGTVAAEEVVKKDPDGYTAFLVSASILTIQPHIKDLSYTLDDFDILTSVVYNPLILMADANGPFQSLEDIIAASDAGETISLGHPGVGTANDIAQKALFESLDLNGSYVPFQANSESLAGILGGHIDLAAVHPAEAAGFIDDGQLIPLAVFTPERYEKMPDVPTISEAVEEISVDFEYKDHDYSAWYYIATPKGLPDDVRQYLEDNFVKAIEDEDYLEYAEKLNMSINVSKGDEMLSNLKEVEETNRNIIEEVGIEE